VFLVESVSGGVPGVPGSVPGVPGVPGRVPGVPAGFRVLQTPIFLLVIIIISINLLIVYYKSGAVIG
jgi:hypothetical protein